MEKHFLFIVCCLLSTSTVKSDNSTLKNDLYIGGFFGVNITNGGWSTAAVIPILEMALDHINNDSNILRDYQLKYVWRDSKVNIIGVDINYGFWDTLAAYVKNPQKFTNNPPHSP